VGELSSKRAAEELHWHEWKRKAKLHGAANRMRDKPDRLQATGNSLTTTTIHDYDRMGLRETGGVEPKWDWSATGRGSGVGLGSLQSPHMPPRQD
jgi:hypothetical protein